MRTSPLVLLVVTAAGCSLNGQFVAADRATYDALVPEYDAYVDSDSRLSPDQKDRRHETTRSWKARLDAAEGQ